MNRGSSTRFGIFIIVVILLALACVVRLFDLQIVKGSDYEGQANRRLVRAYSVPAPRGEIMDRNDKTLVKNRMGYSLQIQKIDMTNDELNRVLCDAAELAAAYGSEIESTFPIVIDDASGELKYDFEIENNGGTRRVDGFGLASKVDTEDADETQGREKTEQELAEEADKAEQAEADWKKSSKLKEDATIDDALDFYLKKYSVSSEFTDEQALTVAAIRYAMEKNRFSEKNPYTLARDVDELAAHQIKEQFMKFRGVEVVIEPVRVFASDTMAAHILGRTGRIYAEEYAEMKNYGYGMNDIIGKDGLEKILEPYLKGIDGYKSVEMNRGGGVTQILQSKEPTPGNFARLTLDRDLQAAAEEALREQIMNAYGPGGSGAVIAVDPKTGGILATASYPTYNPATFNDDYEELLSSKAKPLINRVFGGTYSPGSTFKPLTAIAALETGVISPDTYIEDKGKYKYFDSYQPTCLVYSSEGRTHGTINVSEAIGVSCNYFFYDVGRRTGIEVIDEYAQMFGLGGLTGIELPESTGILASPENRERAGGIWYPGDVLQASIGQSDNMFTPAQLASYVCTILNKGRRYSLHLIDEVVNYDTKEVIYKYEPKLLSENPISESTFEAVKRGMRYVVTSGTASASFETAKYKAAGKTGTAEVPSGRDNVLFVGFAPYENPEIVIAVVIEHGANSGYAANVARKVFDAYMEIKDGSLETDDDELPEEDIRTADADEKEGIPPQNSIEESHSDAEGEGTL